VVVEFEEVGTPLGPIYRGGPTDNPRTRTGPASPMLHPPGEGAPCDRMTHAQLLRASVLKSKLRPSCGAQLVTLSSTQADSLADPWLSTTRNDDDLQLPRVME
jgi:hypothetical protein